MPIYEYGCQSCGHHFEQMQKMSDPAPSKCPECGAKKIEKMISTGSFQLKGGGWYADGYSKEKKGAACGTSNPSTCGGCSA